MTKKTRIHDLAKRYGMAGKALAAVLRAHDFSKAASHMSALDDFELVQAEGLLQSIGITPQNDTGSSLSRETAPKGRALVADLSRLFFALRKQGDKVDYGRLVQMAEGGDSHLDYIVGFTAFEPSNSAQVRLLAALGEQGWRIAKEHPADSRIYADAGKVDFEDSVRFDTHITWSIARLAGTVDHISVVSDSYALRFPILEAIARGTTVSLIFYSDELDPRWRRIIEETDELEFIDIARRPESKNSNSLGRKDGLLGLP